MKKRRKRGTSLPRLTILAYSRADLLRFTEAVERLVTAVGDLQAVAAALPRPRPKKPPAAETSQPPLQPPGPVLFS